MKSRVEYLKRANELLSYVEGNWEHSTDIQDKELVEWLIAETKSNYTTNADFKDTLKDLLDIWESNRRYSDNTFQHEYCNGYCDAIEKVLIMIGEDVVESKRSYFTDINF